MTGLAGPSRCSPSVHAHPCQNGMQVPCLADRPAQQCSLFQRRSVSFMHYCKRNPMILTFVPSVGRVCSIFAQMTASSQARPAWAHKWTCQYVSATPEPTTLRLSTAATFWLTPLTCTKQPPHPQLSSLLFVTMSPV